ncbi:MAG: glycosyltransferase family 2 protein [Bacteroidota bacterium]
MKCDVVVISYNTKYLVGKCIESIYSTANKYVQNIIVVDNCSSDGTVEYLRNSFPDVFVVKNEENFGYSYAVNRGMEKCSNDFVIISNSDVIYLDNSIERLLKKLFQNKKNAVVFPRQIFPNGNYQYSYGDFPNILSGLKELTFINPIENTIRKAIFNKFNLDFPKFCFGYADGAVLAVRKSVFDEIGGFDEDYFFYSEDMDFSYKIKSFGKRIIFCHQSRVIHLRGASSSSDRFSFETTKKLLLSKVFFAKKHNLINQLKFYAKCQIIKSQIVKFFLGLIIRDSEQETSVVKFHKNNIKAWLEILDELHC